MQSSKTCPKDQLEASFDIVCGSSKTSAGDEVIYEAQCIKVCDQVAQAYIKEIGKYLIAVSSSEILDAIMDEAQVTLATRHQVLIILSESNEKPWKDIRVQLDKHMSEASI